MPDRLERLIARTATILGVLAAGYYVTLGGEYSIFDLRELEDTAIEIATRVDSLRARSDSIGVWGDSLEAVPYAIERVAREHYGFIRDGERLYRFVDIGREGDEQNYASPVEDGPGTGVDRPGSTP